MVRKRIAYLAPLLVLTCLAGGAPSLEGDWTLDAAASDGGSLRMPADESVSVRASGDSVTIVKTIRGGTASSETKESYIVDGNSHSPEAGTGNYFASWGGSSRFALVLTREQLVGDLYLKTFESWGLSEDGATLTIVRSIAPGERQISQRYIFRRTS